MKDIHYQEDDFEKAGKSIGSLIGKGAWGKGTIDHLKKVSKNLEEAEDDIARYDTDGVISFHHTSQTTKYQEIFEDFDVLYRFSDQIGDIVNNTIDHPFYEKLDDFVAGMRDLDATTFTTENRIGATTTTTQFENSYTQKQVEVPKSKVSLEDLFSGDTFYADQMKLQYDAWKQTNKGEDVSHQDFQAAMLNSRAFAYTSIKDEQQKTEFWTLVVATIVIVGVSAFCPLAGVALSAAYGTLEISAAKTGKDWMTGRELDATERAQRGAFAVLDVIPGVKALTGGVQMMRSGSRLANVSDALLQGVKNVPTQVSDITKIGQTQMRTRMASLKTATQDALQVATQKGIKGLDKVGQTATAMKGSLNLPPRAHLALAGMGGIPNQAPSKIAQGTENLKDVLQKFDVNLGGGSKRADGIIEKANGANANLIDDFVNGKASFDDALQSYSQKYAEIVSKNEKWSWNKSISGGENLSIKQKKLIKEMAVNEGLIPDVKVTPVENMKYGFADFEGAGVVEETIDLPKDLWLKSDKEQFNWLNEQVGGARPGKTWHHTEIPGKMELVDFGIHNITSHNGGRTAGMWADSAR
ncbi:HNH endonuclease [Listeria goaensis]|uniref:HNH endonuclease signature motif containing protein n=1 Tax=Listeria goaensis TaxID=1649188 RepID=UPI001F07F428|nr:HNH endonuclease [Listeria goaensis]